MYRKQLEDVLKDIDLRKSSFFYLEGEPFPAVVKNYIKLLPKNYDVFLRIDEDNDITLVIEHEHGRATFRRYRP